MIVFLVMSRQRQRRAESGLRESEAELRETQRRMDLAARAADLGIWVWDIVHDEIWASETERALFGFAPSEKLDIDRFRNAIHPDDRASMRKALENSLNTGVEYEGEHRVVLPNRQTRWLDTRGRVEIGRDGKPARMRGVSFDVTRRKLGEEALSESEARFRTMADTAPVMIWVAGPDKLYNFFNKPWLEFTGRSPEQEMGNGWAEGVHPDDLQTCLKIYTEAFDARRAFVMQYRLRRHDGEYRWISDQGVARYDAEGNFAGYIGSCVDVTELINKDAALRESEERMRLAADAVNLVIWELDLTKDEIWATNRQRTLLGWPASGKVTFEDFISQAHPDDRGRLRQIIDDAVEEGKDYNSEYRLVLPDGIVRWMAMRGSVHFDKNLKPARVLGISIDITDRKLAEKANRDLAHASRVAALGELTASIAHEINQPLGAILSNADAAELLLESESPPLDEVRKILADIRNDDVRASKIIRHIRLLTRKRAMQIESLDVNEVTAEVVRLVEAETHRRNVSLHTEFAAAPATIFGDRVHLQQVLMNLILNGMEAMADTPEAERRLLIRTETNAERMVEISVTDSGQGIPSEKLPRLFESFFTTKENGMGLGLAISRSIIDAHQGRIFAENNSDGGATFRFNLPIGNGGTIS